jgi:hypothetical protein
VPSAEVTSLMWPSRARNRPAFSDALDRHDAKTKVACQ